MTKASKALILELAYNFRGKATIIMMGKVVTSKQVARPVAER